MNQQARLFALLFQPSLFSFVASVLLSIGILGVINWSYATQNPILYDYFYGPQGLTTRLEESSGTLAILAKSFSAQYITYELIVFVAAILVGLIVYAILQSISHLLIGATYSYMEFQGAPKNNRLSVGMEIGARLLIRTASLAAWFFYWIFWSKVLFPFCIIASGLVFADLFADWVWAYGLLALFGMIAGLHVHVVFARLLLLKPRVFGGQNDIMAALLED